MNTHVELTSIAMSKNDPTLNKLDKYDVEANIEEVDNSEEQSVFKYGFTALSNPKNVRLAIEGIAKISGDSVERNEILEKDENDIPKILTMIYHELFPTFFLLSKSLNVSSPPHTIGTMNDSLIEPDELINSESIDENISEDLPEEILESSSETSDKADPSTDEKIENPDIVQSGT
ncbi:hypothetical protein [Nitrosopumilus sp.]|uniref:hypothetical protein n=1 Tax=Nitrosopumilus sp. TaxID=2024843 RepID=UPI00262BEC51|nr:hypothetical protein [Nitrosopumilus sp.]